MEKEMKNELSYWIWFSNLLLLPRKKKEMLLQYFGSPKKIWKSSKEQLKTVLGIGEESLKLIESKPSQEQLTKYLEYMEKNKIYIVTIQDKLYPKRLMQIYDAPFVLYIKGNITILNNLALGVIGCRNCSDYGKRVAQNISYSLAKMGIVPISGMAKGIDSMAHGGCLQAKKQTIAVVGCGLDTVYPKENQKLQQEILYYGGAIVSEYIVGIKPEKKNFPARNRIISGMSEGIIVVEAKQRSGTLITVDFALEQGRDVFAVPGNITSPHSVGTNELIKQGAKCVTCLKDVLEEISLPNGK